MATPALAPLLVGTEEAARLLGISKKTVWNLMDAGKLSSVKVLGRRLISVDELRRVAQTGTE